jgi:hypothetical protein
MHSPIRSLGGNRLDRVSSYSPRGRCKGAAFLIDELPAMEIHVDSLFLSLVSATALTGIVRDGTAPARLSMVSGSNPRRMTKPHGPKATCAI